MHLLIYQHSLMLVCSDTSTTEPSPGTAVSAGRTVTMWLGSTDFM